MGCNALSLTPCLSQWIEIGASQTVLNWISGGIPVVFVDSPPSFELPNHPLTTRQTEFIDSEIKDLLASGAIVRSVLKPKCLSPLGVVPKKRNKLRLITDLRKLNLACDVPKFRYEDITTALDLVQPFDNLITVDLQNGFHHMSIAPKDQTYFGFTWRNKYYVWRALPLGWKGTPTIFIKQFVQLSHSFAKRDYASHPMWTISCFSAAHRR